MYNVLLSKFEKGFPIISNRIKDIIKSNYKIVIIPWSFANELDEQGLDDYYETKIKNKYTKYFIDLGINNITYLNCYRDNEEDMIRLINESDALVLTGGNPEMFYNKVLENNLIDTIKNYNKVIIGSSAGAELQLSNYFITAKNNYYEKFDWYKGFGNLNEPFYFDVHSTCEDEYLSQFKDIAIEKKKDIYAIFDDGAIIYNRENNILEQFGQVVEIPFIEE